MCLVPCLSPSASSFFQRWRAHATAHDVALEFSLCPRTVRRLFARFELRGAAAIGPDYGRCGQDQPAATAAEVVEQFCQTRTEHSRWGSEMIRLEMGGTEASPCARTIRRHLSKAGLQPAPAGRRPSSYPRVPRAQQPHQGWQIDASEELRLRGSGRACWLRVVDECSGAFLQTLVFPQGRWENVGRHQIQEGVRQVLSRWGLPERMRADNGYPFGCSGEWPPEMALWLIGLGIDMLWIPPGCPQHNGVVERGQQTGQNWCEPQTCSDASELQRRCDEMDHRQRQRYPYRGGRSRLEVYPQLAHSGRKYSSRQERSHWDAGRVWQEVAKRVVKRQVDRTGSVSVYNRGRYVGKAYIGTQVYVSLDPTGPTWVIADEDGRQLRTHAADELAAERVRGLSVTCRKSRDR